jgi:putative ABC transport system substrate-binding protein
MEKIVRIRFSNSYFDNRKSKTCPEFYRRIENLKWPGLSVIAFVLVVTGAVAQAQQPGRVPRIGYLASGAGANEFSSRADAFRQGLRDLGYVEGKNIAFEYRRAEGKLVQLPDLAAELVGLKVDIIVVGGNSAIRAAKNATTTIPIVMPHSGDPVADGFVASLARPGGNITGLTSSPGYEISGKRLELLKESVPKATRVAVLRDPNNPGTALSLKETETAAQTLKVHVESVEVRGSKDFETAFRAVAAKRADALLVLAGGLFNTHRARIVTLAANSRLPTMYNEQEYVLAGGLMAYATNFTDLYRRAATYVDKILKGAKPADIPVEQPTKFELIINLKAAKQIGLTIPPNVLVRADKVIR